MATEQPVLGILMLEGKMAREPGCLGTAETFPYPVRHRVVKGARGPASPEDVEAMVPLYVEAARALEAEGVRVVTENCNGLMVLMQDRLAAAVRVPVVTSSLLWVPALHRLRPGRVGILTFHTEALGEWHYEACGWNSRDIPVAVDGVGRCESWLEFLRTKEVDGALRRRLEADLVGVARRLVERCPDIGFFISECTLLPPASQAVRRELGLPVFDVVSLLDLAVGGCSRRADLGAEMASTAV